MSIEVEFDNAKNAANQRKHGLSFALAPVLFETGYNEKPDDRRDYGETRMIAVGFIGQLLCVCVYTLRGDIRRIISLRKANRREINDYYQS